MSVFELLDKFLEDFGNKEVLVISSKVVALCEGNVTDKSEGKDELIAQNSVRYITQKLGKWGRKFSITHHTLMASAGIDESNADGVYVLLPKDPQKSANEIREYLCERFGITYAGVIISDSTSLPLKRGTHGTYIAYSGFEALKTYAGTNDLFGRKFVFEQSNMACGLAATAVLAMGEGAEQTPIVKISGFNLMKFQDRNPNKAELDEIQVELDDDLFEPMMSKLPWKNGKL